MGIVTSFAIFGAIVWSLITVIFFVSPLHRGDAPVGLKVLSVLITIGFWVSFFYFVGL